MLLRSTTRFRDVYFDFCERAGLRPISEAPNYSPGQFSRAMVDAGFADILCIPALARPSSAKMAKGADAAMSAVCEAVGKRENTDAVTVRVEFMGRLAAVITRAATRAVQKRLAKKRNVTTSDLPVTIVRQVTTAVEPQNG